jgi:ArsR family transcriptional regulator
MNSYRKKTMNDQTKQSTSSCCPPPRSEAAPAFALTGPEADEALAALCKALGHPARVRIVRILLAKNACVCGDIVDELPLAQSTVSQHLKVLKDAGLIRGDVDGPRVCYCIEPAVLGQLRLLIAAL